ncbi:protein ALP1-like [Pimephales promelas]|nr:protein ALP1-like [Pimephales promelas]
MTSGNCGLWTLVLTSLENSDTDTASSDTDSEEHPDLPEPLTALFDETNKNILDYVANVSDCNMDNELQALLTLMSLLAAVVQANSAFYNAITAYMRWRQTIIRAIYDNSRVQRRYQPYMERRFWVKPGRTSAWWDNFKNQVVVPKEWCENFRMSRAALINLSERLRPHVEGATTKMRIPMDVLTKVACILYYLSDEGTLRKIANAFGQSRQVVSVIIRQVCKAIVIFMGPDYIKTPSTEAEVKDLVVNFYRTRDGRQYPPALES